jgi:hypothetical protein
MLMIGIYWEIKHRASKTKKLQLNSEEIKQMLLRLQQNSGQSYNIKIANRFFESTAQLKYLNMTAAYQNWIKKEITGRLNSGNSCNHSVQIPRSFRLLSRNINIRTHRAASGLF